MAKSKQPTDPRPPAAAQSASPPPAGQPPASQPSGSQPPASQPSGSELSGGEPENRSAGGAAQKRARQRAGRQAAAGQGSTPAPARPAPAAPAPARPAQVRTAPRAAAPAEPPATVRYAVWLMYAGAAFSALALLMTVVTAGQARSLLHAAEPQLSAAKVSAAVHTGLISSAAIWVVTIAMWLIMARTNQAGRGWAGIARTVLCVASTLSFAGYITQAYPVPLKVTVVPLWLAGLAATVLLWRPATTRYIRAGRE